jgi:5'-nucleotidase
VIAAAAVSLTLLHFSDYHSHALPSYADGRADTGGLARAVAFLREQKGRPGTFVLSGGDMLSKGVPAWSDEFGCVEWPWLAGIVDAMALGNHDLDYGGEAFERCRQGAGFPVLSANLRAAGGGPALAEFVVKEHAGIRVGFFALGGPDVQKLVRAADLPAGAHWEDSLPAARRVVKRLREDERVNAVVLIGHETQAEDAALAAAVPGIDLILGTHSHLKTPLRRIDGTATYFVSPHQYLSHVSETELIFDAGRLVRVEGRLVRIDASLPEDPRVAAEVARLQAELERRRPERFLLLATLPRPISDAGVTTGESEIGNWATDRLRAAAGAHAFFSTASSFRAPLPPGELHVEDFLAAMPYTNEIVTARMTGTQLQAWLDLAAARRGSDAFSQSSGVRYRIEGGRARDIQVLRDPLRPEEGFAPIDASAHYDVATTNYQAFVADGYREIFAAAENPVRTGKDVHELLKARLRQADTATALDGRVR